MRTGHALRKRTPSEFMVSRTGLIGILQGAFGMAQPIQDAASLEVVPVGPYHFHQGDLFTPGTGNWALDPSHDTALMTLWGHAFLRTPNTFKPLQPPQVYIPAPSPLLAAQAGIIVGQFEIENLVDNPVPG